MTDFERLEAIIRDILDAQDLKLSVEDSTDTVENWDSLASVQIMTACAQEFGRTFTLEDFGKFGSVRSILDTLKQD